MKKSIVIKTIIMGVMSFCVQVNASTSDLDGEIQLEVESAIADSEAAIKEAEELEKNAEVERDNAIRSERKANKEVEVARRNENEAKRRMLKAENAITKHIESGKNAQFESEEARKDAEAAKLELDSVQQKLAQMKEERERLEEERDKTLALKKEALKELEKFKDKMQDTKKEELAALKALQRAEGGLDAVKTKSERAYRQSNRDTSSYLSSLKRQRENLRTISKKLDEIEIEVETDRDFRQKETRKRIARTVTRSLSSNKRVAQISVPACNLRSFPSTRSDVKVKMRKGQKVKIKRHNKAWYSVVYNGEKAFMGAGCFK